MSFNPFDNLPSKIGAVLLAFLLWVHVATNQTYEHVFNVPIEITNVPSELVLTTDPPREMGVQVRATGKELLGFLTDEMIYRVDLADYSAGNHEVELSSADAMEIFSGGYEDVELLSPRRVSLRLERKLTRELPIAASVDAVAAEGYIIMGDLNVTPERITVTGPESVMKRLREITTEEHSFAGLVESLEMELELSLPDSLRLQTPDSVVVASIKIEPRDERRFENVSVSPPNKFNERRYLYLPGTLSLALGIPRSMVDSVSVDDIRVSFETPSSPEDSTRVPILYRLPDRVNLLESSADSVLIIRKS